LLPNLIKGQGAQEITIFRTVRFEALPEIRILEIIRRQIPARQAKKWNASVCMPATGFLDFVRVRIPHIATGKHSKFVAAELVRKANGTVGRWRKVQCLLMMPDNRPGIVDRLKQGIQQTFEGDVLTLSQGRHFPQE
jgi:hypothetical protein